MKISKKKYPLLRNNLYHQYGFLAAEALVALCIFTFISISLMNATSVAMFNQTNIVYTQCANLLSDNIFVQEFMTTDNVSTGVSEGTAFQCDREWHWSIHRELTNDERFYAIKLRILNENNKVQLERETLRAI